MAAGSGGRAASSGGGRDADTFSDGSAAAAAPPSPKATLPGRGSLGEVRCAVDMPDGGASGSLWDPGIGDSSSAGAGAADVSGDGGDACPLESGGTKGGGEESPLESDS